MSTILYEKIVIPDHYSRELAPEVPFTDADTFTLKKESKVNIELKADDFGTLFVEPVSPGASPTVRVDATLKEGEHARKADPTYWQHSAPVILNAGTYRLRGSLSNLDSGYGSYIFYAVRITLLAPITPQPEPYTCPTGKCGGSAADRPAYERYRIDIPGSSRDRCRDAAELTDAPTRSRAIVADPRTGEEIIPLGMQLRSIRDWRAELNKEGIRIDRGEALPLTFTISPGSADAAPTGTTRNSGSRMQLQHADGTPCPAGGTDAPAQLLLARSDGQRFLFSAESGELLALIDADESVQDMTAATALTRYDADGLLSARFSEEDGLQRFTRRTDGSLLAEWFSPADVTLLPDGELAVSAEPYKSIEYRRTRHADGSETTTILTRQPGLPDTLTTRREREGYVAVTEGRGAEAVTRISETYDFTGNTTGTIESVYAGEPDDNGSTDALTPLSRTLSVYRLDAGGPILLRRTTDYGGEHARTTYYVYDTSDSRLQRLIRPDGSYTRYAYDELGRTTLVAEPAPEGGEEITETAYRDDVRARFSDPRPACITTWRNGVVIRREEHLYEDSDEVNREYVTTTAAGAQQAQTTLTEHYGAAPAYAYAAGRLKHTRDISGVQTNYDYAPTREHGAAHKRTITTRGADGALAAGQSRRSEHYIAADDTVTFEQESIWSGSQWLLLSAEAHEYDAQHRRIRTRRADGRSRETVWMCCGKLSETDENGIRTDYAYNSAQQLIEESRAAVYRGDTCITPETITEYTRDAAGRTTAVTRRVGPMETTTHTEYDALGRTVAQTDALGRRSTTAYGEDGLTTTQTSPTGATTTTTRGAGGALISVSGSAQRALHYSYDTTAGHCRRTTIRTEAGVLLSQRVEDGFGRVIEESVPSPAGGLLTTRSEYNERGQLIRRYRTDGCTEQAPTLFSYDSFGQLARQCTALCGAPTPENSPVTDYAYGAECDDEGHVYSVTRTTRYNAAGEPLVSTQKTLISSLCPVVASESISTDERGNETRSRTEYAGGVARLTLSMRPGCAAPARRLSIDGFTTEQSDEAGVTTLFARRYTASGMVLTTTDARGNTRTQASDLAGRTVRSTDAAGATTETVYADNSDSPVLITAALGHTQHFRYDTRGRKVAEWGTGIRPALYRYDDADRLTALTTFRAEGTAPDADPSDRSDGDTMTWVYDEATGAELEKVYADGNRVSKRYDSFGHLAAETNARGQVTTYSYDSYRNLLLTAAYSDGTAPEQYSYNHLGQLTRLCDAAGSRHIRYNRFGETETDELTAGAVTHRLTERRDALGRSSGYSYARNGVEQQQVTLSYDTTGRIADTSFRHGGEEKRFLYTYLPGTHLLHTLTHPNGLRLTQSYDSAHDLPVQMDYTRGTENALIVRRRYDYDILGRPTARTLTRYGTETRDSFGYNTRSELTSARVNDEDYTYSYDAVGNRAAATEAGAHTAYSADALNQYTAEGSFAPAFDADGNQTLVKTSTGIWRVSYNAKNRPVRFVKDDETLTVECTYDSMGRRATKKVTLNGAVTEHRRFLYRGYLCITACDLTRADAPTLWQLLWDETAPTATRPLGILTDGTWYTYGWDLTKNICETYRADGRIATAYTYTPYGDCTPARPYDQPYRWSSEYHDTELGLVYYNYRHYNPTNGRWTGRDFIMPFGVLFCENHPTNRSDSLGLKFSLNLHGNRHVKTTDGVCYTEYEFFEQLTPYEANGAYTIAAHGNSNSVYGVNTGEREINKMNAADLAKHMHNNGYQVGQNVILYACETADDTTNESFAQQLANELYKQRSSINIANPKNAWVRGFVYRTRIVPTGNGGFDYVYYDWTPFPLQFEFIVKNGETDFILVDPLVKTYYPQ